MLDIVVWHEGRLIEVSNKLLLEWCSDDDLILPLSDVFEAQDDLRSLLRSARIYLDSESALVVKAVKPTPKCVCGCVRACACVRVCAHDDGGT